jgi:hypothetical protein
MTESDVFTYFPFCPLCLTKSLASQSWSFNVYGLKDALHCKNCGAKWHTSFSKIGKAERLQWAELVVEDIYGRGHALLGQRKPAEFWQHTALEQRNKAVEKLREKLRCPYCGNPNSEALNKCPNCGATLDGRWVEAWRLLKETF